MSNRIADLNFLRGFDTGYDITNITGTKLLTRNHIHFQHSNLIGIVFFSSIEEFNFITGTDHSVYYLEIRNDTSKRIEYRVEDQSLQRCFFISHRAWNPFDYRLKNLFYAHAGFSRCTDNIFTLTPQQVDNFIFHFFRHSTRHITLIHYRNNLQVMLQCHIKIRNGLCLHSLRSIYYQ